MRINDKFWCQRQIYRKLLAQRKLHRKSNRTEWREKNVSSKRIEKRKIIENHELNRNAIKYCSKLSVSVYSRAFYYYFFSLLIVMADIFTCSFSSNAITSDSYEPQSPKSGRERARQREKLDETMSLSWSLLMSCSIYVVCVHEF